MKLPSFIRLPKSKKFNFDPRHYVQTCDEYTTFNPGIYGCYNFDYDLTVNYPALSQISDDNYYLPPWWQHDLAVRCPRADFGTETGSPPHQGTCSDWIDEFVDPIKCLTDDLRYFCTIEEACQDNWTGAERGFSPDVDWTQWWQEDFPDLTVATNINYFM